MLLNHVWGLCTNPEREWKVVHASKRGIVGTYISHLLILAAIPVAAGYYGTTHIGWQVVPREVHKLTPESALSIAIASYATLLVTVFIVGKLIHWMEQTYGGKGDLNAGVALAAYTATPLFLVGVSLVYPLLWLNLLLGLAALAYAIYLLYTGVPVMLGVPADRRFLFTNAVLAAGLVIFMGVLVATVILWSAGIGPVVAG